jgi:pyridoxamine 5'-phosphate oxidase-like protein
MGFAQVELLSALVFDLASWDRATGSIDPALHVRGELPAEPQPFVVERLYRGPQGRYDESFALLDSSGALVYQHPYARIHLRGEMFEDRFRDTVREGVTVASADEHTLVFLIREAEIGRIPVFIEAPESALANGVVGEALANTLKKSTIVWLTIPQPQGEPVTRPAWFVYDDGKVFVLTGPKEQQLTNIAQAAEVTLIARSKEVRSRIATVGATVRLVANDSDEFARVAQMGLGTRLNLSDGEHAFVRWRDTCTLVELTPQT